MNFLTLFMVFATFLVEALLFTCGPCLCFSDFRKAICVGRRLTEIPNLGVVARQQMRLIDLQINKIRSIDLTQLFGYESTEITIDARKQLSGYVCIIGIVPQNVILLMDEICIKMDSLPIVLDKK